MMAIPAVWERLFEMPEERNQREERKNAGVALRDLGEFHRRLWHSAAAAARTTSAAATPAATTTAARTAAATTTATAATLATAAARAAAALPATAALTTTAARTAGRSSAHGAAGAVKRFLVGGTERIECGHDNECQHYYEEGVLCGVLSRLLFPEALEGGQHGNTFDSVGGLTVQSNIKVKW
jgi:hypothetical protein